MKTRFVVRIGLALALLCPMGAAYAQGFLEMPSGDVAPRISRAQAPPATAGRRSYLEDVTEGDSTESCVGCRVAAVQPLPQARRIVHQSTLSFSNPRGKHIGAQCRRLFMNADGDLGPVGDRLGRLMTSSNYRRYYMNSNSLADVCPNFHRFRSDEMKKRAWVWFWMVLANEEATCNPDEPHGTHFPDGRRMNRVTGWGLFSAERKLSERYWRGPMCRGDIYQVSSQVNCAVHTMADLQLSEGLGIITSASYWGPTFPHRVGRQIKPNMRGFKACFN